MKKEFITDEIKLKDSFKEEFTPKIEKKKMECLFGFMKIKII